MELELRMYGLVPYNISDIQKGIQFGHAVVEYGENVRENKFDNEDIMRYISWAQEYKTFVILNGGTSNHSKNRYGDSFTGTMEENLNLLIENNVPVATFYEPDLNDMLSGIVWVADERVFNNKDYPDFKRWLTINYINIFKYEVPSKSELYDSLETDSELKKLYNEWVEFIGGERNAFLKEFQNSFSLA